MAEILEYILVIAVATGLAASSLMVLHGSLPLLGQVAADAEFGAVAGAANLAVARGGEVRLVVPLSHAALSCSASSISLQSGGRSFSSLIGSDCHFSYADLSCTCTLLFRPIAGTLHLVVTP